MVQMSGLTSRGPSLGLNVLLLQDQSRPYPTSTFSFYKIKMFFLWRLYVLQNNDSLPRKIKILLMKVGGGNALVDIFVCLPSSMFCSAHS